MLSVISRRGLLGMLGGLVVSPIVEPVARKIYVFAPRGGWNGRFDVLDMKDWEVWPRGLPYWLSAGDERVSLGTERLPVEFMVSETNARRFKRALGLLENYYERQVVQFTFPNLPNPDGGAE